MPKGRRRGTRRASRSARSQTLREELGDDHVVIADLCLDEYTDHGHCGVLADDGSVDNDATLERYRRIAVAQAEAGAHMVGPERHDGRTGRRDPRRAGRRPVTTDVGIMAYAAKFASAFYGPFRDAAECAPRFGDRSGLPDGSGQRRRSDPRDPRRHRRGRRHRDGEAGAPLPRRDPPREGCDRGSRWPRTTSPASTP